MNSLGKIYRITLFGESHGKEIGVSIDGCPAGISLESGDFINDLKRRHPGGPGTTKRREYDSPKILSGIFNGRTTGSPLTITFENRDTRSQDYTQFKDLPRPGHADFVAYHKYSGFHDYRGGGHFSGRLTAPLVAAGVVAKKVIGPIRIQAKVLEAGGISQIETAVTQAQEQGDSIGGVVECRASGVPIGLGEPFFDSTESLISHLVFAIPGIRGIEFGSGFSCSRMTGSEVNDPIIDPSGKTAANHAGGINGGITNGNELVFRAAVKPTSSIAKEQTSLRLSTNKPDSLRIKGRHDVCIALRMPVILEAVTAIALADLYLIHQAYAPIR